MPRSAAPPTIPARAPRVQLGDFWLDWRTERGEWCIAWYDRSARSRRRRSLGIRGGTPNDPPEQARQALARHYLEAGKPAAPAAPADSVAMGELFSTWLDQHVSRKAAPERYAQSVNHLLAFFAAERAAGHIRGTGVMVSDINRAFVDRFIGWRKAQNVGGHTISRDLAALRGALNHAWKNERIATVPFVREVDPEEKAGPREKILLIEQVAGLLEAAARSEDRRHVLLYTLIQLSTCGRTNAILSLDADVQIRDGLIYFLQEGEKQTSKRRSIVPIAPTLAPWLEGLSGKVIRYRAPIAKRNQLEGGPEHFERDTADIGKAFAGCLVEAAAHGVADVATQARNKSGLVWLPVRKKLGETRPAPKMIALATPNTLRHTVITEMHRRGVPEAQIETAAGHRGEGTNKRNYRHLRPNYLSELIEAVEGYWSDMRRYTTVHLRTQCGPNVVDFGAAKRTVR